MGPIFGSLSDRLGKKWFLVGGALLGVVGSVVSGSAHKITDVIAGNILTGAANAGCIVSISAIQEIMPNRLRPWAIGVSQAMASAFVVLGRLPLISSNLLPGLSRHVFYLDPISSFSRAGHSLFHQTTTNSRILRYLHSCCFRSR